MDMINLLPLKAESEKTAETCGLQGSCLRFINDFRRIILSMRDCRDARAFHATLFFCGQVGVCACSAPRTCHLSDIRGWRKEYGSESSYSLSLLFYGGIYG